MLIALVIFLRSLFGGVDALPDRIEDSVEDAGRQAAAIEVVEKIARLEDELAQQVSATSKALRDLHERYDASREDYVDTLRPLEEARLRVAKELLAARVDLKSHVTESEWRKVFPDEAD